MPADSLDAFYERYRRAAGVLAELPRPTVLRLLAEACGDEAVEARDALADDDGAHWHVARLAEALAYLADAGEITPEERAIAHAMVGDGPWPGTLRELIAAASGVLTDPHD